MRTTIEIKPEHRARLLDLAARRGEKGFSSIIAEALEAYFRARGGKEQLRKRARKLCGSLSTSEADDLRSRTVTIREFWR